METRNDDQTVDRDEHDEHNPNPDESGKGLSAIIALLGAWMILEAVMLDVAVTQFWNDILVGVLLLAVGGYNYTRQADEETGSVAAASVAALLGLWLRAAPFVLGAGSGNAETLNDLAFWNDVVVGLLALVVGAYSAYQIRDERRHARSTRTVS